MSSSDTSRSSSRPVRGTRAPERSGRTRPGTASPAAARSGYGRIGAAGGRVTVVLPAYNEATDLPEVITRLEEVLVRLDRPHRILVVDDGSRDGTAEAARGAAGRARLDVVEHDHNRGLGAALSTGLLEASEGSDVVVTMDADNSHDPELIPAMLERLAGGTDVVIASRYRDGARTRGVPWYRRLLSVGVRGLLGVVARVPGVRDYSSGYRAYRGAALRRALALHGRDGLVEETGFACMLEVLLKLAAQGASMAEVPLDLRYDKKQGESKMRVLDTIGRYAAVLGRCREWRRRVPVAPGPAGVSTTFGDRVRDVGCRVLNVGLATLAVVAGAPAMLLIALVVKLSFGGSVLISTTRIGLDRRGDGAREDDDRRRTNYGGRPFEMYKFRTMAAAPGGPETQLVTPPDAPVVPGLGRLLRRLRLDELPQLFNVIKGDMNLVGPRPRSPEVTLLRREDIKTYRLRNRVRPGITGWAQVHPHEEVSSDDSRRDLPLDLEYVEHRSPLRDLEIVLRTIPVMVTGRGAW